MTARLAHICRHPIKSHGREDLASVRLSAGAGLPFDREWAVAHDAARLVPGWNACVHFARGSKAPALMAMNAALDEAARRITLTHPDRDPLTFYPDDPADLPGVLTWVAGMNPEGRAQPAQIVAAGRMVSNTDYPSESILNLASNRYRETRMGMALSPYRWRGNLWLGNLKPLRPMRFDGGHPQLFAHTIIQCRALPSIPTRMLPTWSNMVCPCRMLRWYSTRATN